MSKEGKEHFLNLISDYFKNKISEQEQYQIFLSLTSLNRSLSEAQALLNSCKSSNSSDVLIELFAHNFEIFSSGLDLSKKTIAVWWHSRCIGNQLVPIAQKLATVNNYNYISLVSSGYIRSNLQQKSQEFDGAPYLILPENQFLKDFTCLDLIVFGDDYFSSTYVPQETIRVCQPHGLDIPLHTSMIKYGGGLVFDYILCPMVERLSSEDKYKNVFPAELVEHASNVTYAVPLGYPKLDSFIWYCKQQPTAKKIIYHISLLGVESEEIRRNVGRVIRLLLENFQDREIMFRPDPSDLDHLELISQLQEFKGNPRFSISRASSYIEDYADAEVLVTHRSVTAHTFAYATGRPIVVYPTQNLFGRATENPLGYTVYNDRQLLEKIRASIDAPKQWKSRIAAVLRSLIHNPGASLNYLVESLPLMLERKFGDGWGRYVLFEESGTAPSAETACNKIVSGMQLGYRMSCIAEAAIKKYPDNAKLEWVAAQVYASVSDPFESTYYFEYWYRALELALAAHQRFEHERCKVSADEVRKWLLTNGLDMALSVKWFLAKGPQAYGGNIDALLAGIMQLDTQGERFKTAKLQHRPPFALRAMKKLVGHLKS